MKKKESGIVLDIVQRVIISLVVGVIAALAAALLAYILCSNFMPKSYISTVSFTVNGASSNQKTITESISTPGFSEKVASYLSENGTATIYENVYKKIDSKLGSGKEMITVYAFSEDAKEAFNIADGAENVVSEWIKEKFGSGSEIVVISHANLPSSLEVRDISTYVILAALIVGLLVFGITVTALNLTDTINDSNQISRRLYVDILADFPYSEKPLVSSRKIGKEK